VDAGVGAVVAALALDEVDCAVVGVEEVDGEAVGEVDVDD
jgi:hypothetical protein